MAPPRSAEERGRRGGSVEAAATDRAREVEARAHRSSTELILSDEAFLQSAEEMLEDTDGSAEPSSFGANAADASYDFDEYIFLRDPEIAIDYPTVTGTPSPIPLDPKFESFVSAAESAISRFADYAWLPLGTIDHTGRVADLRITSMSWWRAVCAIPAFNRLTQYSRKDIIAKKSVTPEVFYGYALGDWLIGSAVMPARDYLTGIAPIGQFATSAFWTTCLKDVDKLLFAQFAPAGGPMAVGEFSFDPFPTDEVLFGLQLVHRQNWHLLDYARGDLIRSIPLAPKEMRKTSIKVMRRRKETRTSEDSFSYETSSEVGTTTKDSTEVVNEANRKLNRHAEGEAGGGVAGVFSAKLSGGITEDQGSSSRQTKSRLNERMQKTASRMKRDTKIVVSTEGETTFEETGATELMNPNDEVAVTCIYRRLQERFWVSTELAEVYSVVFVPEAIPTWEDINEDWVRANGEILASALIDESYAPILATIRQEPPNLAYSPTARFDEGAKAGIQAANSTAAANGGRLPDFLGSGQEYYERDFVRRENLRMDQERRVRQSEALIAHLRRHILHYMRAIWASEDHDQRMQRYSRIRVPTMWTFIPTTPPPPGAGPALPLETEGVFMPMGNAKRLTDVINPIGPIGYLFNCAIYRLRDDPRVVSLHEALSYLRAAYTRFKLKVTPTVANITIRDFVAYAPRSFSADYVFLYRASRQKWLIEVKGRQEIDWFEVPIRNDGALDALGLRIWIQGAPADGDQLKIELRAMGDLEDPHYRLVHMLNPLPKIADEPNVFTDERLREMIEIIPELPGLAQSRLQWGKLKDPEKAQFRAQYHRYLMLRESGRLVALDTDNPVLDLELGRSPLLEPFKRLHRYLDVLKEHQELHRRMLDNIRREKLVDKGVLGDPDIENVTLIGLSDAIRKIVSGDVGGSGASNR